MFKEINNLTHPEIDPAVQSHIDMLWEEASVISDEIKSAKDLSEINILKTKLASLLDLIAKSKKNNAIEQSESPTKYISEEKALAAIERLLNYHGFSHEDIAKTLACMDSPKAWELREKLKEKAGLLPICEGLAGIDSNRAWGVRYKYIKSNREN